MVSRLRSAAILAVTALALTACSGETDPAPGASASTTPSPGAVPTLGTLVGLDAFAVTLPQGWTQQPEAGGVLLLGISSQSVDDYPVNVNVVEDSTLAQVAPELLEGVRQDVLATTDVTGVTSDGAYEVDGEQGVRLMYGQEVQGINVVSEEIAVSHADTGYIITFSFSPSIGSTQRDAVIASIMDTWTWAQ